MSEIMEREITEKEYLILKTVARYDKPVGSGTISVDITDIDNSISEATAGRILRLLDQKGFTEKVGYQGRMVTKKGITRLNQINEKRAKVEQLEELMKVGRARGKSELIDLLIARRAIERELAGLAALNADEEQINELRDIIKKHEDRSNKELSGAIQDQDFHKLISEMADNNTLKAALNLIKDDGNLSPVLEFIRKEVGSTLIEDHRAVLTAIEEGNSLAAEEAMLAHINNLIHDVNHYWEEMKL